MKYKLIWKNITICLNKKQIKSTLKQIQGEASMQEWHQGTILREAELKGLQVEKALETSKASILYKISEINN